MLLSVGTILARGAGNVLGKERGAPELWYLQRASGKAVRSSTVPHSIAWSTLSHSHCFDCRVAYPSQANFEREL